MAADELLTTEELAERVFGGKLSARTIEGQRVRGGGLPYVKIGKRVFYRLAAVQAALDARTRTSTSERPATPGRRKAG